jgi:hypothetical protein
VFELCPKRSPTAMRPTPASISSVPQVCLNEYNVAGDAIVELMSLLPPACGRLVGRDAAAKVSSGILSSYLRMMPAQTDQLRRRNHFVPATYLAPFTDEGSRTGAVWVYSRGDPFVPRHLHLTDVGLKRNLYIRNLSSGPDDSVERFFAESIEGPFAGLRDRLIQGPEVGINVPLSALSPVDRAVLARFVSFQLLRTPTEREATLWLSELISRGLIKEQLEPGAEARRGLEEITGAPLKRRQRRALQRVLPKLPNLKAGIKDWLPRTLRNAERFAPLVVGLEWRLVEVPSTVSLVTCDMPLVCVRHGPRAGSYRLGGAIAEGDFEATLTLSPKYFLYFAHNVLDEAFLKTDTFAKSVLRRTIAYAHRWVYSKKRDESISRVLEETERPSYYVDVAGRVFRVGHPVDEIERAIRQAGVTTIQFRYGGPEQEDNHFTN